MTEWQIVAIVTTFLTWFASSPKDLADAARHEALRRQMTPKATRTLTNLDVASVPARPLPTVPVSEIDLPAGGKASDTVPEPKGASETHDEAGWRARVSSARDALERDQVLADALQSRINGLTAEASARDEPRQRALLYEQRTRALAELDNFKRQLDADRQAIVDIQEDARKQGIPAGWIR